MQSAGFLIKWTVEQIWNSSNFVEKYLKEYMHSRRLPIIASVHLFPPRSLPRSSCWSDSAFWSCDEDYIHRNHLMLIIITMPWSLPYSMINIDNMKRALTIGWWQQTAWQKASHVRQQLDNYIHRNHIMLIIIAMPRLLPYSRMNTQKWDHNAPSWEEMITFYNCSTRDWWKTPAHAQAGLFFLEQLFP